MAASNTQQFGQEMMRVLDRGQLELRQRFTVLIDEFIKQAPNLLRRGPITAYTVEDLLTRLRQELLQTSTDLLQRFVGVSSRQIFEIYRTFAGNLETDYGQTLEQLNETKRLLAETQELLEKEQKRTQTLANLIEEADSSISQLMEERESLNTSVSETIRKLREVEREKTEIENKIAEYESQIKKIQEEANETIASLTKKLQEQETKWKEKYEKDKQLWELKLLNAYKEQDKTTSPSSNIENKEETATQSENNSNP
jgi:chromosome segregation ATPase